MKKPMASKKIHSAIARYYADKLKQFGTTPAGADWRDAASQELRFARLLDIFDGRRTGSLIELGCGYGALYGYLKREGWEVDYTGYDIADEMVAAARRTIGDDPRARVRVGSEPAERADYCVASGIFNVRFDFSDREWKAYLFETLDIMAACSQYGFAFNCLTSFADRDRMQARLFYADPEETLNVCIGRYGRSVRLLQEYGLYEFTVLVWHGARVAEGGGKG